MDFRREVTQQEKDLIKEILLLVGEVEKGESTFDLDQFKDQLMSKVQRKEN